MRSATTLIAISAIIFSLYGCGNRMWEDTKGATVDTYNYVFDQTPTARPYHAQEQIPIIEINHQAADVLYSNIGMTELSSKSPVYVKTFENQKDPSDKAIFGNVITEQVTDRLVQLGVKITSGSPPPDAFFLPEDVDKTKYDTPMKSVADKLPVRSGQLRGNYVLGTNYIYMTAKIVRLDDNAVVSGHNWTIPISDNVRQMLPQLKLDTGLEPSVKTKFD